MEKIWIIHNSMYGNSEQISKQIADGLKDSYDVSVDSIKNINPEDIAKDEPHGLIIAVRIVAFRSDKEILKFIKNLDEIITKPISKIAYFSTHALGWKKLFIKGMKKTLEKIGCVEEICPEYLEIKMQKPEGPAVEGADVKIGEYISTLKEFMK
ncbi:MAG: flavodoxin family protein [Candidatus Hermodarchaeota archaeon]